MAKKNIQNKAQNLPVKSDIRKTIVQPEQVVYRINTDLLVYKRAVTSAESIVNPYRVPLLQVYKAVDLDSHLSAAWQQRKNLTLGRKYCFFNKDGSKNEDKTKLLQTKWFRDFLNLSLDSKVYGFSLIQFESIIETNGQDEFKCVELVPRNYVKPEFHIVVTDPASLQGEDYLDTPYNKWTIGVGDPKDLGLYLKAAPLVIWKKNAMGAWAEFIEKYGVPPMVGKTNARDDITRKNMENMLKNIRVGLWGVLDENEELLPVPVGTQDAYNVFDMMIQRCNSELSKLILGQTMTLDDGSSKSQAEVHENVVTGYADLDAVFMNSVLNYQLLPLMNGLGFGCEGLTISYEPEDEWNLTEKSTFDLGLINSGKYKLTPEYLKSKYNTEVEEVEEPQNSVEEVKKRVNAYYES